MVMECVRVTMIRVGVRVMVRVRVRVRVMVRAGRT